MSTAALNIDEPPSPRDATSTNAAWDWPQVPVLEPHHFETEPMESEHHLMALILFYTLLRERFADREDVFLGADLVCYFSDLQVKNKDFRAPDGLVVLGVEPRERQGWIVWQEGGRYPDLVVEMMSPSTREVDLGKKLATYTNVWRVREYLALDLESGELHAFLRRGLDYERHLLRLGDLIESDVLGAFVGVSDAPYHRHRGPWLRLFSADGELVPTAAERAEAESRRAEALAAELEALKAKLEALEAKSASPGT
jgi:Uma2 family endonuclease